MTLIAFDRWKLNLSHVLTALENLGARRSALRDEAHLTGIMKGRLEKAGRKKIALPKPHQFYIEKKANRQRQVSARARDCYTSRRTND